jgi:hypothetical protein
MDRLSWILDGLNGVADWGADAADMLAPEFAALVPPDVFAERVRQRAEAFAPGTVTSFDAALSLAQNLATVLAPARLSAGEHPAMRLR